MCGLGAAVAVLALVVLAVISKPGSTDSPTAAPEISASGVVGSVEQARLAVR